MDRIRANWNVLVAPAMSFVSFDRFVFRPPKFGQNRLSSIAPTGTTDDGGPVLRG